MRYGINASLKGSTPADALVVARALRTEGNRDARRLAEQIERACRAALSKIQTDILRLLAAHRDPESYVAGASPLNRDAPRISADIDVFHDREERVAAAALNDTQALTAAGYSVSWLRQLPLIYTAEVRQGDASTRLEWVVDSDYRYFPTVQDEIFGYMLHPVDLAMNKVVAAAGRRELRDIVDLVTIHETILPLGAVIWAAVEKSPGFTPEGLIAEIRRNANYPAAEWRALQSSRLLDPKDLTLRLPCGPRPSRSVCYADAHRQTRPPVSQSR